MYDSSKIPKIEDLPKENNASIVGLKKEYHTPSHSESKPLFYKWGMVFLSIILIIGIVGGITYFSNNKEITINEVNERQILLGADSETINQEIAITPINPKGLDITLNNVFVKDKEPICQGSICEFEFTIKNPLKKDMPLNSTNLNLWYLVLEKNPNVKSFDYYQWLPISKSRKILVTPESCSYQSNGKYENGSDVIEYICNPEQSTIENYIGEEWKEVDLQNIILYPNSSNQFKVIAQILDGAIDWKIALDEKDTGYLEPDWVLFNTSKDVYRNITFTNVLANTSDWAMIHISLNATANSTIGFPYFVATNGANYSIGYKTNPIRDLQIVDNAFVSSGNEVPFYIYNQSIGTENWTRNFPETMANVTIRVDGGDATDFHIGNQFIDFQIDINDGGVGRIVEWRATSGGNSTCSSTTNTNCLAVYKNDGNFIFGLDGGGATVSCNINLSSSAYKVYNCNRGADNINYTIYANLPFIDIQYRVTSTSSTTSFGSNIYYGNSIFASNEKYYYFDGTNRTATFTTTSGNFVTNISSHVINGSGTIFLADYWLFKSDLGIGGDYGHVFRDSLDIGGVGFIGVIPDGAVVRYRYGIQGAGDFPDNDAGVRAKQLADSYYNPPIITISPQFSIIDLANNPPVFEIGYPQLNSTDGSNTTIKNLTVIWKGTDQDINNILKYNITWFTNNITNFTLRNIAYTNGTLKVDLLKSVNNLTGNIGKTWKAQINLCDNSSACIYSNTSELLILATAPTTPVLNLPTNNMTTSNYTINLSAFGSQDPTTGATGLKYEFYLDRELNPPTTLYGNTTIQSNITILGLDGVYYWRVRTNNNQTVSQFTETRSFYVDRRLISFNTSRANNSIIYSSKQTFDLNITFNKSTTSDVDAIFIYGGSSFTPIEVSYGDSGRLWYYNLPITSTTSKSWNWNLTITQLNSTVVYNTSFSGATSITDTNFALCNTSLTSPVFLNITFRDESTNAKINASIEASTFNFYMDDHPSRKSYTFTNTTNNFEYDFCGVPSNAYLNLNITNFAYKSNGYAQRNWEANILSSGSYNQTLYLLSTSVGSYTTFQVLNSLNQPIENVYITMERQISGVFTLQEAKFTDASGGATFFVNPTFEYRFTFAKSGFLTYTTTITPTQSTYTIQLSTTLASTLVEVSRGITYTIKPTNLTLNNNTVYTFSFDIDSSYWSLSEYGFTLINGTNPTVLGSAIGTTSTGSLVSTTLNTGNNTLIQMNYYWLVNSTYANGTKSWYVFQEEVGSTSISYFCTDLKNFSRSGFNNFSRGIIAAFIIFVITAGATFALSSYIATSFLTIGGLIVSSTWLLSACGQLVPSIVGGYEYSTAIILTLIFMGFLYDEFIINK